MAIPALQKIVVGSVAPQEIGKASGVFSTLRQLGWVFGVAILVAVFAGAGGFGSAQTFTDGFVAAIAASAALSAAGAVAGAFLPGRRAARFDDAAIPSAAAIVPRPSAKRLGLSQAESRRRALLAYSAKEGLRPSP
jgi:hypothetical protein